MHKWYVLQVFSGQEKKVKKAIEEQIDHTGLRESIEKIIVPSENVSEVKRGQQRVVEKRLWPGYILIKMILSDESWGYIKKVSGVIDFLGGGAPAALSDEEVAEILADLEEKKETVVHKHQFDVGNSVKIVDGVFINFIGTVQEVFYEKGTLSVLVSIFGRETRVDDLEFAQVERVTAEERQEGS